MKSAEPRQISFAARFGTSERPGTTTTSLVLAALALAAFLLGSLSPSLISCVTDGSTTIDVQVDEARFGLATACAALLQGSDPPVADAGSNRSVYVGAVVPLNGSASSDDVGITKYTWTFFDNGSVQTLFGEMAEYVFWTPGLILVALNVTDADGHWSVDTVAYTVELDTTPPVVQCTSPTICAGQFAQLDASSSSDNARIVNFTWTFEYEGTTVTLYGMVTQYQFNRPGTYEVMLVVTDASGLSSNATVIVTVCAEATWLSDNWLRLTITAIVAFIIFIFVSRKLKKDHTLLTSSDKEKMNLQLKNLRKIWKQYRKRIGGMIGLYLLISFLFVAVFAPWIGTKDDPNSIASARDNPTYARPSVDYPFGTDFFGRDVYSLTMYGARASLMVGTLASLISIVLGTGVGLAAGYFGRISDEILMRVTDFFLVLPWFPLMIVFASLMGRSFTNVIIVIGITSWPSTARIVRAQVLSVKEMGFIERARAIGSRDGHIISKHILPNVFPLIFANTILLIANSIFSEAFLDFFGFGDPNVVSWGLMLEEAYGYGAFSTFAWWWIVAPGTCIVLLIMSFYLIGDSLDEIFNPRLKKR